MIGIVSVGAHVPRRRLQRQAVSAAQAWFAPDLRALDRAPNQSVSSIAGAGLAGA